MVERQDPDAQMASERLGRVLGGTWTLERVVGVGGMAAVYEAVSADGSRAALKVLHPEMSRRPELRQRFAQEGAAASRVDHPGVVRVLGNGEEPDGTAYLVLELLEGEPLGTVLRRDGPLPIPRLLEVLDQVLDVLAVAHAAGIVHRDLKPDNLFVTRDQRIKVLDFGIARMLDDVPGNYKTRTGVTLGTVPFMSPEQAIGKRAQIDGRSDLFSLGAMTFRIIARRNVHEAETDAELLVAMASKPAPPLHSVAPDVPQGLAAIVDVALAFSKDSRYPDAATMQKDVRAFAEGKPPPYASRLRRARDMATRVDLAVAPASMEALTRRLGDVTPSPPPSLSTMKTEPMPVRPDSGAAATRKAAPPVPLAKDPEPDVDDLWPEPLDSGPVAASPAPLDSAPLSGAPSSRRVMSLRAVPDLTEAKQAAAPPAETARTEKVPVHPEPPKDGKTLVSNAPPALQAAPEAAKISASRTPSRAPLFIGGFLIALASAGAAYYFAQSGDVADVPASPASDHAPAAHPSSP